jgi:2-polyprenyl-3-methyl-5-hydroxy-6-metoxy-1,4-benzoquinol methylase
MSGRGCKPDQIFFEKRMRNPIISTISRMAELHNTKYRILEVGCGSGADSICLAINGHNVTALDISEHRLNTAKELSEIAAESFPLINIEFVRGDIFNLKGNFKEYDVVFNFAVIQIWKEKKKRREALLNMKSTLKENGFLCLVATHTLNPLFKIIPVKSLVGDMADYNRAIMEQEVREAGFEIIDTKAVGLSETFDQWLKYKVLKIPLSMANYFFESMPERFRISIAPHILIWAIKK